VSRALLNISAFGALLLFLASFSERQTPSLLSVVVRVVRVLVLDGVVVVFFFAVVVIIIIIALVSSLEKVRSRMHWPR
jgi:hypothetical protein